MGFSGTFSLFLGTALLRILLGCFFYALENPSGCMVLIRLGGPRLGSISIVFMVSVLQQAQISGL